MEKIEKMLENFFEITEDEKEYNCCYAGTHTTRSIVVKEKKGIEKNTYDVVFILNKKVFTTDMYGVDLGAYNDHEESRTMRASVNICTGEVEILE